MPEPHIEYIDEAYHLQDPETVGHRLPIGLCAQEILEQIGAQMAFVGQPIDITTRRVTIPSDLFSRILESAMGVKLYFEQKEDGTHYCKNELVNSFCTFRTDTIHQDFSYFRTDVDLVKLRSLAQYKGVGPFPGKDIGRSF